MPLIVTSIADDEHELVQLVFDKKMRALQKIEKKNFAWVGFDKSKYLKTVINNEAFIVGAGNVFRGIMEDVLLNARSAYPEAFGQRNASRIIEAIYKYRPVGHMENFQKFLQNEQFALIFKVEPNGEISEKVLRIDLFRDIKPEQANPQYNEFIGGIMHALKHFSCDSQPLSTNREDYNIEHPNILFELIIKGFFMSKHKVTDGRKGLTSVYPLNNEKDIKCSFFNENYSGVFFLNTVHIKNRKLPRKQKKQKKKERSSNEKRHPIAKLLSFKSL